MSDRELSRLEVLRDLDQQRLTTTAAGQLLGLERRQVWRLLNAFRRDGAAASISKKLGRPSNRKTAAAVRAAALWIVRHKRCRHPGAGGNSNSRIAIIAL